MPAPEGYHSFGEGFIVGYTTATDPAFQTKLSGVRFNVTAIQARTQVCLLTGFVDIRVSKVVLPDKDVSHAWPMPLRLSYQPHCVCLLSYSQGPHVHHTEFCFSGRDITISTWSPPARGRRSHKLVPFVWNCPHIVSVSVPGSWNESIPLLAVVCL